MVITLAININAIGSGSRILALSLATTRRHGKVSVHGNRGRGFRLSPESGKCDYLVLDYVGNIERHGPVDAVRIRESGNGAKREGPQAKEYPACREMVHPAVMLCPSCGYE